MALHVCYVYIHTYIQYMYVKFPVSLYTCGRIYTHVKLSDSNDCIYAYAYAARTVGDAVASGQRCTCMSRYIDVYVSAWVDMYTSLYPRSEYYYMYIMYYACIHNTHNVCTHVHVCTYNTRVD